MSLGAPGGRRRAAVDRVLDPADERFACRGVADQRGDSADLREALIQRERDVEQFVVNAHAP